MAMSLALAVGSLATLRADNPASFDVIPLGTYGGLYEDNLSSYLLAPHDSTDFLALDAGTVMAGLARIEPVTLKVLTTKPEDAGLTVPGAMLKNHIKAYLISHAHLDHLAGLAVISTDDLPGKDLLGTDNTIKTIQDSVFNWKVWPNFGDAGTGFALKFYKYVTLQPGDGVTVRGTLMTVKIWPLDHSGANKSTAFLIGLKAKDAYALYFGDTGPDAVEKGGRIKAIWTELAPMVQRKALKGIFLEASYPTATLDTALYGHLTPAWLMSELDELAAAVANLSKPAGPTKDVLKGITLVVTHVKPTAMAEKDATSNAIMKELNDLNAKKDYGLTIVRPQQGVMLKF
jgi:3',5'-cyclic-nucleotide phosphodiesterase